MPGLFAKSLPERAPFLQLITIMFGRSSTPRSPYAAINKTSVEVLFMAAYGERGVLDRLNILVMS